MRSRFSLAALWIVAGLVCSATMGAHADAAGAVQRSIQAIYDKQALAGHHLDAYGAFTGYAADSVTIDKDGKLTSLSQERKTAREFLALAHTYDEKMTIQKIAVAGDRATVYVSSHITGFFVNPQTNRLAHFDYGGRGVDTWKKIGGSWFLERSKTFSDHTIFDGRSNL